VLPLAAGLTLFFVLPHPWNGLGLAAGLLWEIAGNVYGLRWSQRAAPLVGTDALVGVDAIVVIACAPRGRVKVGGETWQARSQIAVKPGQSVCVRAVEGLTLHVEPRRPGRLPPLPTDEPSASPGSAGSQGNWLWLL
jgi:membrane-bound serine protease (ClpP class)